MSRIFTSKIFIKLAGFAALTAAFALFTTKMLSLMGDLESLSDAASMIPILDPAVLAGLNLLPANTSTYLLIGSCSLLAQFAFISISRAVKALT